MDYFLKPPIKYTGSKFSELSTFLPYFPEDIDIFYEPFIGGGSVFLNTKANKYHINDYDKKIFNFWNTIFSKDTTLLNEQTSRLLELDLERFAYPSNNYVCMTNYPFSETSKKNIKKHNIIDEKSLRVIAEREHQANIYYLERDLYNTKQPSLSTTFWVTEFAYCGMSRYNSDGVFNVPYGGISYNNKDILPKINSIMNIRKKYNDVSVWNNDFECFLMGNEYKENDFIFLDPPYTTTFSSYGNNSFDKNDHTRLRNLLKTIECKFLMILNYDDFTKELYEDDYFKVMVYDKKYKVNIKNRMKDNDVKHMIVMNYNII